MTSFVASFVFGYNLNPYFLISFLGGIDTELPTPPGEPSLTKEQCGGGEGESVPASLMARCSGSHQPVRRQLHPRLSAADKWGAGCVLTVRAARFPTSKGARMEFTLSF